MKEIKINSPSGENILGNLASVGHNVEAVNFDA